MVLCPDHLGACFSNPFAPCSHWGRSEAKATSDWLASFPESRTFSAFCAFCAFCLINCLGQSCEIRVCSQADQFLDIFLFTVGRVSSVWFKVPHWGPQFGGPWNYALLDSFDCLPWLASSPQPACLWILAWLTQGRIWMHFGWHCCVNRMQRSQSLPSSCPWTLEKS